MNSDSFKSTSIDVKSGIPVFSDHDDYIENYNKIAQDHLLALSEANINPFMGEDLSIELENSTRSYIERYVSPGARILDVGVGLGRLLAPLTQFERYGIDISIDYLKIAMDKGINVAFSKIEDMPYVDEYFDAIVVTDVLEHVFDLNACCRKIIDVLKPGGVLIIRVPYKEDLNAYLDDQLPYEFIHIRSFDEASLRLLFCKVFKLNFSEAATVAPYLQGTPRFKVRLLPEDVLSRVKAVATSRVHMGGLLGATSMSAETLQFYLYSLRDQYPEDYQLIVNDFVYGIEINAVFLKPALDVTVDNVTVG